MAPAALLARLTEKHPDDRPHSYDEVRDALGRLLEAPGAQGAERVQDVGSAATKDSGTNAAGSSL